MKSRWTIDTATVIGGRTEQQDRVAVMASDDGRQQLVVLADGMGGLTDGAMAAQTVIDVAGREFGMRDGQLPGRLLERICSQAHRRIVGEARRRRIHAGSTCVALYLDGDEAYWVHAGDSRLYHYCGSEPSFRTRDHTWAALMSDDESTGEPPPGASRLYACLGGTAELVTEHGATALGNSDWLLLCSDGFWSQVSAEEAADRITGRSGRGGIAEDLAALAASRAGAGGDNVSLALVRRRPRAGRWFSAFGRRLVPGRANAGLSETR